MKIRQKRDFSGKVMFVFAFYVAAITLVFPSRSAESVKNAMTLSVLSVVPSLAAFAMSYKIMAGKLTAVFSKLTVIRRIFSVSSGGLCMIISGLFSGFPMGAVVYSELSRAGAITEEEGETIMPYCTGAGAAFLIGTVGAGMNGDISLGIRLFACQSAAALVMIVATRRQRRNIKASVNPPSFPVTPATAARAIAEGGQTMIGVTAFIVFFSVLGDALAKDFHLGGYVEAALRCLIEISGGVNALSRMGGEARRFLGFAVGFSGISVFMQCHFASGGEAMRKYIGGKIIMSSLCGAMFFITEIIAAKPVFFEIFGQSARGAEGTAVFISTLIFIAAACISAGVLMYRITQKIKIHKKLKKEWKNKSR